MSGLRSDLYNQIMNMVREETTSADVAYAPQMGLSRPRKEDIDLLDNDEDGDEIVMNESERKKMLARCLNEDDTGGIAELQERVATELPKKIMKVAERLTDSYFAAAFGGARGRTTGKVLLDVVITRERFKAAHDLIMTRIKNADRGTLELILSSLKDDRPITRFEEFDDITSLGTVVLRFNIGRAACMYIGMIDTDYMVHESLQVPENIADIIDDEFRNVSISRNAVYPTGGVFHREFARQLKGFVEDAPEEGEASHFGKKQKAA